MKTLDVRAAICLTALLLTIVAAGCKPEVKQDPTQAALEKAGVKVLDDQGMADATGASREAISALEKDKIFISTSTKEPLGQVSEVSFSYLEGSLKEKLPKLVPLLKQIPNLSISLGFKDVDGPAVAALKDMDNIVVLNLNQMSAGDEVMPVAASLKNLKVFQQQPKSGDKDGPEITGAGLKQLASLPKLQYVSIHSNKLTDEDLAVLKDFKALTRLGLGGGSITDKGIEKLAELPQLRVLYVSSDKLTPDGLKPLSKLVNLEEVDVYGLKIDAKHREFLKSLPKIKKINGSEVKKGA